MLYDGYIYNHYANPAEINLSVGSICDYIYTYSFLLNNIECEMSLHFQWDSKRKCQLNVFISAVAVIFVIALVINHSVSRRDKGEEVNHNEKYVQLI